jgi:hypothetical protein
MKQFNHMSCEYMIGFFETALKGPWGMVAFKLYSKKMLL